VYLLDELFNNIKKKFELIDSNRYWGDDYDVRYYLVSQLKNIKNKRILDIGGGIGVISSELDKSNQIINLDLSKDDLTKCKVNNNNVLLINGSMTELPFGENNFDVVICSHLLEVAKFLDIKNQSNSKKYPTVEKVLTEIHRVLKNNSKLYLTTPNNAYYQTTKLTYHELISAIQQSFQKYSLFYFNTHHSISKNQRKLNLSNLIPKVQSKFKSHNKIINSLCKKDKNQDLKSISFYVEVMK
jgi:ubiquinone/menaquinone biosynthesis C-methylase UbiE|tara:strand:- start:503 stop:1228 length:726 start_codon:yes stop_codon:yes gene_type:complete